jgi:hypothetical protein
MRQTAAFAPPGFIDAPPDLYIPLTGVTGTGAVGVLGVTLEKALTGTTGTGAVGTTGVTLDKALTGVVGAGSVGSGVANLVTGTTTSLDTADTTIAGSAQANTTGNTLLAFTSNYTIAGSPYTVTGVSDTAGNTYTRQGSVVSGDAGVNHGVECWAAFNITGHAANVVTVTFSGGATYRKLAVAEYDDIAAYDAQSVGNVSATGTVQTTATVTTTNAKDVLLGYFVAWTVQQNPSAAYNGSTLDVATAFPALLALVRKSVTATGTYSTDLELDTATQYFGGSWAFKEKSNGLGVTLDKALTGTTGTGAVGTLGKTLDKALTGTTGTGAVGTLGKTLDKALTGATGTGAVGTLGKTLDKALTGVSGTGAVGNLASGVTLGLVGVSGTGAVGTLTPDDGIGRPAGDVTTTDWTATPGPTFWTALDEVAFDDADYITSPSLAAATPITMSLDRTLGAGNWNITIRSNFTGTSGQIRATLLNNSDVSQGVSGWQVVTATFTEYTLAVTTSGDATRIRFEVAA